MDTTPEVPTVIFDIQRVGPSTGLPTRTAQADILSTAVLSHGDTKHLLLLPASVGECYSLSMQAFDLAERFQTPVFVMSDLDLGMNAWMSDPFEYPDTPIDRGKWLDEATLARIRDWGRYKDIDGDGVPYRTIPGDGMPSYFCRGSGHDEMAEYSECPEDYEKTLDRLARKFETARKAMPRPVVELDGDGPVAILAYGTSHWAVLEGCDQLRRDAGISPAYCRLRAFPFTDDLGQFIDRYETGVCRRAEPRRSDARPDAAASRRGAGREAAQHPALFRAAARRPDDRGCDSGTGRARSGAGQPGHSIDGQ